MAGYDVEALLARLPSPMQQEADESSTLQRYAQALHDGHWSKVDTRLTDIENQLAHIDKTGDVLKRLADEWDVGYDAENDSDERIRILTQGKFKRLLGGTTPEDIRSFVAAFLQADQKDVTITENEDASGDYVGAEYDVSFSSSLLEELGFESPYTDLISDIETILSDVSAAGVKATVTLDTADTFGSGNLLDNGSFETVETDTSGGSFGTQTFGTATVGGT